MSAKDYVNLIDLISKSKVSSVLNRDVKEYGKKFMFDERDDTCWNSDQGSPQFIVIDFSKPVRLRAMNIQFQGGFAGKVCKLKTRGEGLDDVVVCDFYPEDVNTLQKFDIDYNGEINSLKILFESSTDFFGRIIVYQLELIGEK